jgi:hypothetical protein
MIVSGGRVDSPDLSIPEAFPLQSTFGNVHFPLAIACMALLVSIVLALIRRDTIKTQLRYGLSLFLIMVAGAIAFGWFMYLFI